MKTQNLLGNGNSKLQKTAKEFNVRIFNFSIPAGNDKKSGKITCPFAGSCLKLCYAKRGMYRFGNVERALTKRYEASKEENFVELISNELSKVKKDKQIYVRIHDSGDFYSPAYFNKWVEIAMQNRDVRFYAYTKSHSFIRSKFIPYNMDLIFSLGSTNDELIDQQNERHSKIFYSSEDMHEQGYTDSSYLDIVATKWVTENNKIGLLIH
jgi:hypothetical protein